MTQVPLLSKHGASTDNLLDMFCLLTRSVMEMACPIFSGEITNIEHFEKGQKGALKIIICGKFPLYENALKHLFQTKNILKKLELGKPLYNLNIRIQIPDAKMNQLAI